MTLKDKIILFLLSIITIGIYPIIIFRKRDNTVKKELSSLDKTTINIDKLRKLLGESQNIIGSEYTHTKVKIFVKNPSLIDINELRKLKGISGLF